MYLLYILVVHNVVIFLDHLKNVEKITYLKKEHLGLPERAIPSNSIFSSLLKKNQIFFIKFYKYLLYDKLL
jgi:hypothetical protein